LSAYRVINRNQESPKCTTADLTEISDLIQAPDTVYDPAPMKFFLAIALTVSVSMTAAAQRKGFKVRYLSVRLPALPSGCDIRNVCD
jgi:hypothetical protein